MDGVAAKSSSGVSVKTFLIVMVLAVVVPSILLQKFIMIMYVPSESMYPTLETHDVLLGTRLFEKIDRGDVVAFQTDTVMMVKRVIGLPGESVLVDEKGRVWIDDTPLEEPYVENQRTGAPQSFFVPDGCLLLLGDNRTESYDARYWDSPYVDSSQIRAIAIL